MVANVEITDRVEQDDSAAQADSAQNSAETGQSWFSRLTPVRLTSRIVLLNIAGLIILVSGTLYFNQFRQGLIDARVQSLLTQGQIMAAALASAASIDTDSIVVDPDRLMETRPGRASMPEDDLNSLDFPINPERAGPVLRRLVSTTDIRGRIYDRDGLLVVDSRGSYSRGDIVQTELPPLRRNDYFALSLWRRFNNWLFRNDYPQQPEYGLENGRDFAEVTAALNGASVSIVRVNDQNEIIVSVAVPIQRFRAVLGALVLSTQGGEIDKVLRGERKIVLFTFLVAVLVTMLLSILLAGTIAEPIRRLSAAAERVRRGVNNRVEIPDFTARRDEIGHLSGSLRDMTTALYNRIDAIEAFAADVSHELKNPLTSLRSAVETLPYAKNTDQRDRLTAIVKDDVKRLDRLITDISDASRLDAELARAKNNPVDLRRLLDTVITLANETRSDAFPEIPLELAPFPKGVDGQGAYRVLGHDNRLGQVVRNLVDNARSFTRPGSQVRVRLRRTRRDVEFRVEDEGPGIRAENLDKIFDRFYTDRPEGYFGKNSGLGLSISKQIVEAHRGRIWAENRFGAPAGLGGERAVLGAVFIVRIPALAVDWEPHDEA
ncbi:MAG TPA: sensor histidine kinase [Aestuariivirgaceae bacterium]|nr:sensor histidine kinase [Aestuariivirgaceae bacterium]